VAEARRAEEDGIGTPPPSPGPGSRKTAEKIIGVKGGKEAHGGRTEEIMTEEVGVCRTPEGHADRGRSGGQLGRLATIRLPFFTMKRHRMPSGGRTCQRSSAAGIFSFRAHELASCPRPMGAFGFEHMRGRADGEPRNQDAAGADCPSGPGPGRRVVIRGARPPPEEGFEGFWRVEQARLF